MNQNRISKMPRAIQSPSTFQHKKFIDARMVFYHHGRSGHRSRNTAHMDRRAICVLWRLDQCCANLQIQTARPAGEVECGLGCQPNHRFARKSQFSARVFASSDNRFLVHNIIHRRSPWRTDGVEQFYIIGYSHEARFSWGRARSARWGARSQAPTQSLPER